MIKRLINKVIRDAARARADAHPAAGRRDPRACDATCRGVRGRDARADREVSRRSSPNGRGAREARRAELKAAKRNAADPAEREQHRRRAGRRRRPRRRRAGELRETHPRRARRDPARGVRHRARGVQRLVGTTVERDGARRWSGTWCPYDVQLIGGIQLHRGRIAEMATGEGKTLVATLPLYLNALPGKGAHLVTVNSYLARRDSQWMGHVYRYLGLTVGCLDDTEPGTAERRAAYAVRHHLRHEQRVRVRLPARQHGRRRSSSGCSAAMSTRSSTRSTRSSSTRRGRR